MDTEQVMNQYKILIRNTDRFDIISLLKTGVYSNMKQHKFSGNNYVNLQLS